jgi:hypothetical protein
MCVGVAFAVVPCGLCGTVSGWSGERRERACPKRADWAKALEQRDSAALSCLLAAEFEDAGPDGALQDRNTALAKAAQHRPVHNELTEMRTQVQGDFGFIRGLATAADAQGKILARVRFTDIYVYRDGRWQAVAAHESMLAGKP